MKVKNKFEPIINSNSEILILGSFPSIKSREENFYYMNEYNRFWKVLSILYDDDFNNKDINVKIRLIGKYFFLDIYCGNNHTIEDIITALNLKINNRRDNFDILMG